MSKSAMMRGMTPQNARDRMLILLWGGGAVVLLGAILVVAAAGEVDRYGYSDANPWFSLAAWLVVVTGAAMLTTALVAYGVEAGVAATREEPAEEQPPASPADA